MAEPRLTPNRLWALKKIAEGRVHVRRNSRDCYAGTYIGPMMLRSTARRIWAVVEPGWAEWNQLTDGIRLTDAGRARLPGDQAGGA
jgi:hypothetical protein